MLKLILIIPIIAIMTIAEAGEKTILDEPVVKHEFVEDDSSAWVENKQITIPAYPQQADLIEFSGDDPNKNFRYFIDAKSLTVDNKDQVVRYTLVIQSPTGTNNIAFEGMRCDTYEYKTYATDTGLGRLEALASSVWLPIKRNDAYQYHRALREYYFCQSNLRYRPYAVDDILHRLSTGSSATTPDWF